MSDHDDMTLFEKLRDEHPAGSEYEEWHGNRHLGVQFQGEGARHNGPSAPPALSAAIAKLERAFGIVASASRINLYRGDGDYKPLHHDRGRADDGTPQVTVGVSFGDTRELSLVHVRTGFVATFPMKNGDVFAFTPEINDTFTHGVPKICFNSPAGSGQRLSLILWGAKVDVLEARKAKLNAQEASNAINSSEGTN